MENKNEIVLNVNKVSEGKLDRKYLRYRPLEYNWEGVQGLNGCLNILMMT